jgi:hypothetical protein
MTYRFNLISIVFGLCLLFLAGSALAGPASAASPPTKAATPSETAPPAASEGTPQSATPAAKDRAIEYAKREKATPRAGAFKGSGVGVYIGGSTLAVVLVIVIVVVLL